jgi:hypothetical protein
MYPKLKINVYFIFLNIGDLTFGITLVNHCLEGFHSVSLMRCLGNRVVIRGNALILPNVFVVAKRILTICCLAMDYFITILTCTHIIMLWELESSGRVCCSMYWTLVLLPELVVLYAAMNLCDEAISFAQSTVISPALCLRAGFSILWNSYMCDEIPGYLTFKTRK